MKFDAQFAWEHVEDDPLAHSRHDVWTVGAAPPRASCNRHRSYRLAFLVSTVLILAGTVHLWRDAKAQQHVTDRALAVALEAVIAPDGPDAQSLLAPAVTHVKRRSDLAYVDVHASTHGHSEIVLRETVQGWQRLAPTDGAWGEQQEFSRGAIAVTYWAKDASIVRAAAVQADARSAYIRRMLGLGEPAAQLDFLVAPDVWGMPAGDDNQRQIVLPNALDTDAARIAHLTEAFLRPQVAASLHELARPAVETVAQERILAAVEDWLVVNAYPHVAGDPTVRTPASGNLPSTNAIDVQSDGLYLSSQDTTADVAALVDDLITDRGYTGLGELLRAMKQGQDVQFFQDRSASSRQT